MSIADIYRGLKVQLRSPIPLEVSLIERIHPLLLEAISVGNGAFVPLGHRFPEVARFEPDRFVYCFTIASAEYASLRLADLPIPSDSTAKVWGTLLNRVSELSIRSAFFKRAHDDLRTCGSFSRMMFETIEKAGARSADEALPEIVASWLAMKILNCPPAELSNQPLVEALGRTFSYYFVDCWSEDRESERASPTTFLASLGVADCRDAAVQCDLGVMYAKGQGLKQDYVEAVKWYQLAAAQDAKAQRDLGTMCDTGKGVPQDFAEAIKWYRLAAAQRNADAQSSLGWTYYDGRGVKQDFVEAVKWYRLAATQRNADAQSSLGWTYYDGRGVKQDFVEAVKWYRLAAEQGDAEAQYNLGVMHYTGKGIEQDCVEAVKWFRLAAQQGNVPAQSNLGAAYAVGQGVKQDFVRAFMWLSLGSASGDIAGQKNREIIAGRLTPQQIVQAQQMARECQQRKFKDCD